MGKYAVLMFAEPAHTRAMSESALDVVARKHATLREELTAYYEIECDSVRRAQEIAARVLDDHVTAVELRRIHDTA